METLLSSTTLLAVERIMHSYTHSLQTTLPLVVRLVHGGALKLGCCGVGTGVFNTFGHCGLGAGVFDRLHCGLGGVFDELELKHGGGFYIGRESNTNVSGITIFVGNSATSSGGGVYAGPDSNVHLSGEATFVSNSASFGGRFYAEFDSNVGISGSTILLGTQLEGLVEEFVQGLIAMWTSVETPLSLLTQL